MRTHSDIESSRAEIVIGALTLYFSYQTCVAFSGPVNQYQSYDRYSNTTSRHKGKMGCGGFVTAPTQEEFVRALEENFAVAGVNQLKEKLAA